MAKVLLCRDLGFDCDAKVRADTEDEALKQLAIHARTVHHLETVPPEVVDKACAALRDEQNTLGIPERGPHSTL